MQNSNPIPIAFVAMPFGTRSSGIDRPGIPKKLDFDMIWDRALAPALEELGYLPIRADEQAGSVIIKDMLEQLVYADIVIADISVPNANVYYEAGVRHVAKEQGCVLIGAQWAEPVFDLQQIRQVRYPYIEETPESNNFERIKESLKSGISQMRMAQTPIYELTDYPEPLSMDRTTSFKQYFREIGFFQSKVRAARLNQTDQANEGVESIVASFWDIPNQTQFVAVEVFNLVRDRLGWSQALDFILALPSDIAEQAYFRDQYCLAIAKTGKAEESIVALEQLIELDGATCERYGLLGGRYKSLFYQEKDSSLRAHYLDLSIENYTAGMNLDLNEYYCACNLPRLLKSRDAKGDSEKATFIANLVIHVCEVRKGLEKSDGWENPALLGATFDIEDVRQVTEIAAKINRASQEEWHLESSLPDLFLSAGLVNDSDARQEFIEIVNRLASLVWITQSGLIDVMMPVFRNTGKRFYKFKQVRARKAIVGERIDSHTSLGFETSNTARAGDYVVQNQTDAMEQYLVSKEVFELKYGLKAEENDEWAVYQSSSSSTVLGLTVDENVLKLLGKSDAFYIEASWGGMQKCMKGDVLVALNEPSNEIYRIAQKEFSETYQLNVD